ncbi:MAG: hypothetical protein IJY52_00640 [Anaerotignum sp.]|nr:hypothetical protein [Anaerotignum sp.]
MITVEDRRIADVEPHVYLPITEGETYKAGEALTMGATATKCAVDAKPDYICAGEAKGGKVPAAAVMPSTRYCIDYTAKPTIGDKVQLSADGMDITATTGGAFKVFSVDEGKQKATGYFE